MDVTRLKQIIAQAKEEGFDVRMQGGVTFTAPITDGQIRVDLDRDFIKDKDEVHLHWTAATVSNLDYAEMFSEWMSKAVSLMKELYRVI